MGSTGISLQRTKSVLFAHKEGSVKDDFQIHQEFANLLIWRGQVVQVSSAVESGFRGLIQSKPVQKGRISLVSSDFEEFSFEVFVGRLEEGEQSSSRGTI